MPITPGGIRTPDDSDEYDLVNDLAAMAVSIDAAIGVVSTRVNRLPYAMAQGLVSITPTAANTPTGATVTFPVGRFTVPPRVQVTAGTNSPGINVLGAGYSNATANGTIIYLTRNNATATPVAWLATQMTETNADG